MHNREQSFLSTPTQVPLPKAVILKACKVMCYFHKKNFSKVVTTHKHQDK